MIERKNGSLEMKKCLEKFKFKRLVGAHIIWCHLQKSSTTVEWDDKSYEVGQSFWEYFKVKVLNKFVQFQGMKLTLENTEWHKQWMLNCLYEPVCDKHSELV